MRIQNVMETQNGIQIQNGGMTQNRTMTQSEMTQNEGRTQNRTMTKNEGRTQSSEAPGERRGAYGSALILSLMLVLVMISSAACGGNGGGNASSAQGEDGKVVLKLEGIGGDPTRLEAATIALYKGFFDEVGIEIEDVGVVDIPQQVNALVSKSIDAVSLMTSEGLTAVDNGADIVQVATNITTIEGREHMTFLVLEDSDIRRGSDLIGKRIGTASASGGCTAGFPIEYMRQDGVEKPKTQVELQTIPEESLVTALEAGDSDVVGVHLTKEQVAILYPQLRILFTDYDILGETGGDTGWFFRRDYIDENPETVTKFISAIIKAQQFINANRDEAGEIYKEHAVSLNPDLFWIAHFDEDGLTEESHVQLWIDLFAGGDSSYTLQNKDIKPADFVTDELNPNYGG